MLAHNQVNRYAKALVYYTESCMPNFTRSYLTKQDEGFRLESSKAGSRLDTRTKSDRDNMSTVRITRSSIPIIAHKTEHLMMSHAEGWSLVGLCLERNILYNFDRFVRMSQTKFCPPGESGRNKNFVSHSG